MSNFLIIRIRTIQGQTTKVYPANFDIEDDPDYAVSKKQNPHGTDFSHVGKASGRDFVEFWQGQPAISESILKHVTAEASKSKMVYKPRVEQDVLKDGEQARQAVSVLADGWSSDQSAENAHPEEEGLRGFIISVFRAAIYLNVFAAVFVGFIVGGYYSIEFSIFSALLGAVTGLLAGSITSGFGLVLLDIRDHLWVLRTKAD